MSEEEPEQQEIPMKKYEVLPKYPKEDVGVEILCGIANELSGINENLKTLNENVEKLTLQVEESGFFNDGSEKQLKRIVKALELKWGINVDKDQRY